MEVLRSKGRSRIVFPTFLALQCYIQMVWQDRLGAMDHRLKCLEMMIHCSFLLLVRPNFIYLLILRHTHFLPAKESVVMLRTVLDSQPYLSTRLREWCPVFSSKSFRPKVFSSKSFRPEKYFHLILFVYLLSLFSKQINNCYIILYHR